MPVSAEEVKVAGLELVFPTNHRVFRRADDYFEKKFKTHFGRNSQTCAKVWSEVTKLEWLLERTHQKPQLKHFLWCMNFMHAYRTEGEACTMFDCDEKTWRKWTWVYATAISKLTAKYVKFEDRLIGDTQDVCTMTVDGTDFKIWEPRPFSKEQNKIWYSSKFKGAGVRYELAIAIKTGEIVWINGPFPCGWGPDLKIFNQTLKTCLLPFEKIMADRNYRDSDKAYTKCHVEKYEDDTHETITKEYAAIAILLARHETVNGRFKEFGCLNQVYRHERSKHHILFSAVAVIIQIEMRHGGRPVFDTAAAAYADPILNYHY
eukprot:CAMPEP_0116555576 /NCGR_PEP_ID=MMETSP0397-20121206/8225_1 /TAXON_ID=216820 /ORGANISM="Cyclophora tenuis, Strain ECT3854" /LENGTH=318 /DNA_ID=CAMNT_0004080865 /DNA_START=230 /DNA_END=1186 /DNA_ORIENTATION=-